MLLQWIGHEFLRAGRQAGLLTVCLDLGAIICSSEALVAPHVVVEVQPDQPPAREQQHVRENVTAESATVGHGATRAGYVRGRKG